MKTNARSLWLVALLAALTTGSLEAQVVRVMGTVVDEGGQPLEGVRVTVETMGGDTSLTVEGKTNKKGRYTLMLLHPARAYLFRLEKEGFQPIEKLVEPAMDQQELNIRLREDFTMTRGGGREPRPTVAPPAEGVPTGNPQAIAAYNEGAAAFNAGDREGAEVKFREALEHDPNLPPAYLALAGISMEQGEHAEAAAMAEKLLELEPHNVAGLEIRYDAYKALGEKEKAAAALEALMAVDPSRNTAVRVYNAAAEALRAGDVSTAVLRLQQALEVDPSLVPAHSALANIYLSQKQYEEALQAADQLLQLQPGDVEGLTVRYEAYRALGEQAKAQEAFDALSAANPGAAAEAFYKQGVALFNAGNMEEAKGALERAAATDPNHAKAHYMLGLCYVNLEDNAKARQHLEEFLRLAPNDPDAPAAREMLQYLADGGS